MTTKQAESGKPAKAAPSATISLLQKLAANKKKRNAAREAEAQQRAAFLESEQRAAEQDNDTTTNNVLGPRRPAREETTFTDITALQDKLGLGGCSTDYLDTQKILYPVELQEPTLEVDGNIAAATKEALTSLGLYNSALSTYFQDDERIMTNEVFRNAVISGTIATQAIKKKQCSDETAKALFSLLAFSNDGDLAGAAFRTLLCMLGEDTVNNGSGLDARYGFDNNNNTSLQLSAKAVPSAAVILDALVKNGYNPDGHDADKAEKKETGKETGEEAEEGVRIYSIKLLLHTAVAVCNHCSHKQEARKAALPRSDVSNLLIAVMYMGLDSAAVRLQPDLDAACIALLGALTEDDWSTELPLLSKKLAAIGKSSLSRLRILRQLPVDDSTVRYRARQLQRFAGCILVEKILPKNLGPKSSAIPSRPWFRNAKGVVTGAKPPVSSTSTDKNPSAYTISEVELLLHLCDVLLWPSALRMLKERTVASGGGNGGGGASPSPMKQRPMGLIEEPEDNQDLDMQDVAQGEKEPILSAEFLTAWNTFLTGIVRNIKTLQPEEMAVKTLASRLEFKYKEAVEKPVWASPGLSP